MGLLGPKLNVQTPKCPNFGDFLPIVGNCLVLIFSFLLIVRLQAAAPVLGHSESCTGACLPFDENPFPLPNMINFEIILLHNKSCLNIRHDEGHLYDI
jgi:hypothetical protein